MTPTAPHEHQPPRRIREGGSLLGHVGWFVLVSLVLIPATKQGRGAATTALDARVAVLELTVEVEPTGLGLHIGRTPSVAPSFGGKGRTALQSGRSLWLADIGLGASPRELGRAARDLVQGARLDRGAMATHVRVSLRAGKEVDWWHMYAVQRDLEEGLEGRPGFTAPATLRIALNSGPWDWRTSEKGFNAGFVAVRDGRTQ